MIEDVEGEKKPLMSKKAKLYDAALRIAEGHPNPKKNRGDG